MKVLIFSTAYLPFVGGAELAIKEITDRIPDISFALITVRFKRGLPKREKVGNIEVYRVGFGISLDKWLLPFLGASLAKRLNRSRHVEPFSTVWSMMASQGSIAAAWFRDCFPNTRLVLTLQEGDEEEHLKRYVLGNGFLYRLLIRPWHTAVFKRADAITAISNYLANRARSQNTRAPITVMPNGVDIKKFEARSSKLEEEIKKELGISKEDKVIITTSRLVEKNGVGDLIEAMQYLPEKMKLVVCGTGQLEGKLKLEARSSKLEERVKFLGQVTHEELPRYLHVSDVFCRPSLSEGMGNSFIEAMAAGLPVVATPVGGIPDFLFAPLPNSPEEKSLLSYSSERFDRWSGNITGLFAKVGDPKDIAEKIKLLLSNDELRSRIVANASKMVRKKYDWDGIAKRMEEVFVDRKL